MSETEPEQPEVPAPDRYDVYLYDLPKVDDDGKAVPTEPAETREFTVLTEAQQFAAEKKDDFDRIVLIKTSGEEQSMMERFRDGERIVPETKAVTGC